jgi:hypothetical protein
MRCGTVSGSPCDGIREMSSPAGAPPQTATDDHYRAAMAWIQSTSGRGQTAEAIRKWRMENNIRLDRRRLYDCMREAAGENVNQSLNNDNEANCRQLEDANELD